MSKKPSIAAIRATPALTVLAARVADRVKLCNVCGTPDTDFKLWRECDENDKVIAGSEAVVLVGANHKACATLLDEHPRLYHSVEGEPGHFPLCGPCVLRKGMTCTHPALKANGGAGLNLRMTGLNAIVCTRRGRVVPLRQAVDCEGREVAP